MGSGTASQRDYTVRSFDVVEDPTDPGFVDPITSKAWFIPLQARFSTNRHGLGIHPDGNVPGTLGCIGLQGMDASKFWRKWNSMAKALRPTALTVT